MAAHLQGRHRHFQPDKPVRENPTRSGKNVRLSVDGRGTFPEWNNPARSIAGKPRTITTATWGARRHKTAQSAHTFS